MTHGERTLADLHEALGRAVATGPTIYANEHRYHASAPSALRGLAIDARVREYRAEPLPNTESILALQADWDETSRLIGEATDRYRKHRNVRLFRMETRQIIEREDAPHTIKERMGL